MTAPPPLLSADVAALAPFVEAGVLDASAVHVAGVIARSVGGVGPEVLLGAALAARAPRLGHVCVAIGTIAGSIVADDMGAGSLDSLPWPDPGRWTGLLAASPAVSGPGDPPGEVIRPLVWDDTCLYLERYWRFERQVADELLRRAGTDGGLATLSPELDAILDTFFKDMDPLQREAARKALTCRIAVIGGGPGTGKTRTIARLLGAACTVAFARGLQLDVALAAPTATAAARMEEAVHEGARMETVPDLDERVANALGATEGNTLHRLLGAHVSRKPRYDRFNPLPHDLVVVDETSMVSLPLMARVLDAVRPDATLVLVGDPFQLASIEAGAVLGEIVGPRVKGPADGPLADDVVLLEVNHRSAPQIAKLANAIRLGDEDTAVGILVNPQSDEVTWVKDDDQAGIARLHKEMADNAVKVIETASEEETDNAERGLGLASDLKVLCATRSGALGVSGWSAAIEALVARELPSAGIGPRWYVGRPIIVTRNDYFNKVFNGDVGLVVSRPNGPVVAFLDPSGAVRELAMSQLGDIDTWWAATIHKSQGSEFARVIVSLPPAPSPILTRELLYTAVTRAREHVTVVAAEESVRRAIAHPAARASGLREKLWP